MHQQLANYLRTLGISRNYRGCYQTILAVELFLEDESRLFAITEQIYPAVARRCGCNTHTVERNIRTAILRAWHTDPDKIRRLAGRPLQNSPTVAEFIDMLAARVQREGWVK